jgi:predicted nucleic acid-binding protein
MPSKAFLDSNVLIFGHERPRSNSRRILDLLVNGEVQGVVTDRVVREVWGTCEDTTART